MLTITSNFLTENEKLFVNQPKYYKAVPTFVRLLTQEEIDAGETFHTYTSDDKKRSPENQSKYHLCDDGTYVKHEAENTLTAGKVYARNGTAAKKPKILGTIANQAIYNDYLINKEEFAKLYGDEVLENLTTEFTPHLKKIPISVIKITPALIKQLGGKSDDVEVEIKADWGTMKVNIGDYLASGGYGIKHNELIETYVDVDLHNYNLAIERLNQLSLHDEIKPNVQNMIAHIQMIKDQKPAVMTIIELTTVVNNTYDVLNGKLAVKEYEKQAKAMSKLSTTHHGMSLLMLSLGALLIAASFLVPGFAAVAITAAVIGSACVTVGAALGVHGLFTEEKNKKTALEHKENQLLSSDITTIARQIG